ncbi:MAG TPA: endopeptidase La [Bacillota bacterium]
MVSERRSPRIKDLPLLPLRGMLIFPHMMFHLDVGREKSINAVEEAMIQDRLIVLATQKEITIDQPAPDDIYGVGTLAEVKQLIKLPAGVRVLVEGLNRVRILEYTKADPLYRVLIEEVDQKEEKTPEVEALMRALLNQFEQYNKLSKRVSDEILSALGNIEQPGHLADTVAAHLNMVLKIEDKQHVLEAFPVKKRLETVHEILGREIEILELERKINFRVRKQMEKTQREYYLREQLKAIHKELGDRDEKGNETEEFHDKLKGLNLPKESEEKVLREIERFEKMPQMSAEAVVVRNYLEWVLAMPWNVQTEDRLNIDLAKKILDEDHYGLDKVKDRILEYLAIRKLAQKMKGPILCLVGPPGVGKTSLAKSVARALERKFVRISLGGVRDEAEIRGHRRTYVGALPGRIVQGMRQAGSKNPVFLMDEIDKMSSDFRGDPASALLEVLDPEQNNSFSDHYIELPFDLSKVLFITTANNMYNIPRPLLDRMEMIYISGYTEEEKVNIAQRHLVPKVIKDHGLTAENTIISENAIRGIIRYYTREAGVRNLEREIASICRKVAKGIVRGTTGPIKVNAQTLHNYLGIERFHDTEAEKEDEVGVATGVAVTDFGGDIMPIEVSVMKGKGALLLTGKLGEVMRESAQAGYSWIRSKAAELQVDEAFYEKYDLHVHIPEGAIPKDGPSAGITMATAIVSALSGRPVRRDVAMTGEITLRGRVLPIGGLKEKVLAAHRAGLKTMIIPRDNRKDTEEIPANVRRKIEFVFVESMEEVLDVALAPDAVPAEAVVVEGVAPPALQEASIQNILTTDQPH